MVKKFQSLIFEKIETRMLQICREKHDFKIRSISKKVFKKFYENEGNKYKVELIRDLKDGEITFCDHSNFTSTYVKGSYSKHINNQGC